MCWPTRHEVGAFSCNCAHTGCDCGSPDEPCDTLRIIAELRAAREVIREVEKLPLECANYPAGSVYNCLREVPLVPDPCPFCALATYRAVTGETEGHGNA